MDLCVSCPDVHVSGKEGHHRCTTYPGRGGMIQPAPKESRRPTYPPAIHVDVTQSTREHTTSYKHAAHLWTQHFLPFLSRRETPPG